MTELPPLKVYTFPLISLPGLHAGKHKNLQCFGVVMTVEAHFISVFHCETLLQIKCLSRFSYLSKKTCCGYL